MTEASVRNFEAARTRWVTAALLEVLARHCIVEGGTVTAGQLADWTAGTLTPEQRVHATSKLCALEFFTHGVKLQGGERVDVYTLTAAGAAAVAAAEGGHVRKSGPKGARAPNPVDPDALSSKLWRLVRLRKIVDSDSAARTLCDAGDDDFERVRATVRRTLRRWEQAGALSAGSKLIKRRDDPVTSNGSKRYVLVVDSVEPPRWRPAVQALRDVQEAAR